MFNLSKYMGSFITNKKSIFCLFLMILFSASSYAQDRIHKINGAIVEAEILEVGTEVISYRQFNNPSAGIFSIKKSEVKMIAYQNGEKTIFEQPAKTKVRKEYTNYLSSVPKDASKNSDIIITSNGTEIYCLIDNIESYKISYHIKRTGADPAGSISKSDVLKYYYKYQWFNVDGSNSSTSSPREIARNLVKDDKINKAIAAYAKLVEVDSLNSLLLAENAYALALGGVYDAALYRLDRSWTLGVISSDINFFTAQVFALMGYKDLANDFWKESIKNKKPKWISSNASLLLEKYKRKNQSIIKPTPEQLIMKFKMANALASQNMYFQSIALFQELTYYYPNEYLPYIGYSITLEKAGALSQSAKTIEKAITLIGDNPEQQAKKQILTQRLKTINNKVNRLPDTFLPGLNLAQNENQAQTMLYAGGMVAPSLLNLNLRMGYFISGSSNASIDFGFTSRDAEPYTNLGISVYTRSKIFVGGVGFLLNSGGGSTAAYLKLSSGISIMNKKRTSSFDTFLDLNQGFKTGSLNTWGVSVGTSFYFGRRK